MTLWGPRLILSNSVEIKQIDGSSRSSAYLCTGWCAKKWKI